MVIGDIIENYQKTDNIIFDVQNLFLKYGKMHILEHSKNVSLKAVQLAHRFSVDSDKVIIASYLHDISGVIGDNEKIKFSESLGIDILDEERSFPLIIHQKLSKEISERIFGIQDKDILQAISCHTTLCSNPSKLDMVLFISDKIAWDQSGEPPYLKIIEENIEHSLEEGISSFLQYLMDNKNNLKVVHPWLIEAHEYFIRLKKGYG